MQSLSKKVAIVTGASSGIGRATAKLFAREGACIVCAARRQGELDSLTADIEADGGTAIAVSGDGRNEGVPEQLVATAVRRFGRLDIAFNNAGILGKSGLTETLSQADWAETLDVNLTAAFLAVKHQLPVMAAQGSGSIVFTSSFVGNTVGLPGMAAYAASKAGLLGLMRVLAVEYGPKGVRANALLPGGTDTPMAQEFGVDEQTLVFARGLPALKRTASPEEQAQAALYLASDASSYTTGHALLADGGVSICRA